MTPAVIIFFAWIVFGGSHLGLSASNIRERMAPHFGPNTFTLLFSLVTCLTISGLITVVVIYGAEGISGPNMGRFVWARWVLVILGVSGCLLAVAGLLNYPRSPMAVLARRQRKAYLNNKSLKPPSSVECISRHPFFTGLALLMLAHTLLATTLASAVYFGGYVVMALIGIPLQDKKLRQRWRETYTEFENSTRVMPFAQITEDGLQNPTPIQWGLWISAILITAVIFGLFHPIWALANGALFGVFILLFGFTGVLVAMFSARSNKRQ